MFGTKSLTTVLAGLEKTLNDLQEVAGDQVTIAMKQEGIIAGATAIRNDADETLARANRIADKLADLLA
jgi:NifB/MoaA-like Fe-S oxidoreductase